MNKNFNIIVYLIIISIILIGSSILTIFIVPNHFQEYARIINLMIWIVLFILSAPIENEHSRFKGKKEKIKTTLIIVILYYMIYFLLGLIFGYQRSPYSKSLFGILKNIIFIVGSASLEEFVRSKFVNADNNKKNYIFVTAIFIIINIDYSNFLSNFQSGETIFKFVASNIMPQIAISCVCTYLAKTGGYQLIYAYRLPILMANVILPIFPNVDWFFSSMLDILIALILFVYINYEHIIKTKRLTRKEKKNINPKETIVLICFTVLFIVFIGGAFPYKPVAVMSNSMVPEFKRGYVVIVKKVEDKDIKNLKVGDILEYRLDKNAIIHRIIAIEKDEKGEYLFTLKGDNNDVPDLKKVEKSQVIGVIKFEIPYVRISISMV